MLFTSAHSFCLSPCRVKLFVSSGKFTTLKQIILDAEKNTKTAQTFSLATAFGPQIPLLIIQSPIFESFDFFWVFEPV